MCQLLRLQGSILEVTVKREAGRWFACVTVCMKAPEASTGTETVGVDVGVRMLATCSDETTYENPRARLRYWNKIQRCKERLARQKRGSPQHDRLRRKLEKIYYRVHCLRDDNHHKAAMELVADKAVVAMETLGLLDMLQDKRGAGALSDAALGSFQNKIIYRCEAERIEVIKAGRWFPSSQLCSACGVEINRDFNAALNLERYGKERT